MTMHSITDLTDANNLSKSVLRFVTPDDGHAGGKMLY